MRRFYLAASMVLSILGNSHVQALTLEEAVASAIDSNPDVLQQYARYQAAVNIQDSARGDYMPQVRLTGGYGREDTRYNSGQKIDEELNRSELGLTVSQLLFNGFKTSSDVARLGEEASAERFALISAAENTALEVCRVYLNLLKSQELKDLSERNVLDHIQALDDITERTQKGLSSQADLAQVSARLASARASMMAATNNVDDLRAEFRRWVGQESSDLIVPISDKKLMPPSLAVALERAKSNHPELQVAKADIRAAKEEQRGAKYSYYPRFSVEFAANKNEDIGGFRGPDEDARLMLKMEYDLFNGLRDKNRAEASGWRYHEAMAISKRTYLDVEQGTHLAWNARRYLEEQMKLYKVNVDATTAAHSGYIQQFRLGRRTLLDVLDSQVELFLARRNYIGAKYDHALANYRVSNAVGTLLYALRVEYPDQWDSNEALSEQEGEE